MSEHRDLQQEEIPTAGGSWKSSDSKNGQE